MLPLLFSTGYLILLYVTILFLIATLLERNDIADIGWGFGIVLIGLMGYLSQVTPTPIMTLLCIMVLLWGVRLSIRILLRNIKRKEDVRYAPLRIAWKKHFYLRSYLQIFVLQGMLMMIVAYPLLHASVFATATTLTFIQFIGACVWGLGFSFEAVADYELDQFLRNPQNHGTVMDEGLWRYSRHPNYFGEVTQWWGIFIIVFSLPLSIVALISPLLITLLILKVSGIPMLEKHFDGNEAFESYKKRTSAFVPMPARKNVS